jgi:succinate dehydrogenase flavin-adding protein (antitoxin of CptAB toxin-antitoxin module)
MNYEGDLAQYRAMSGVNFTDRVIAEQLEQDHGVKLSEEDLARFSDFLTAKDPRYVAWSPLASPPSAPFKYRFENFEPYYRAYLEFKAAGAIKH